VAAPAPSAHATGVHAPSRHPVEAFGIIDAALSLADEAVKGLADR
jgi:hypothetical protein